MHDQQQLDFGDYPVMSLAGNPLSPQDGRLGHVREVADVVLTYRGYTICATRALGAGVIYRPNQQPLTSRGLWQVVPSYEAAVEVINLDLYWNTLEGAAQVPPQSSPVAEEPWGSVDRLCRAAGVRWHNNFGSVIVIVSVEQTYVGSITLGVPEVVATWSQSELEERIARQLKRDDGVLLSPALAA